MTYACPLCKKKCLDSRNECGHSELITYGYFHPDGNFYLSPKKGMFEKAKQLNFNPERYIEIKPR